MNEWEKWFSACATQWTAVVRETVEARRTTAKLTKAYPGYRVQKQAATAATLNCILLNTLYDPVYDTYKLCWQNHNISVENCLEFVKIATDISWMYYWIKYTQWVISCQTIQAPNGMECRGVYTVHLTSWQNADPRWPWQATQMGQSCEMYSTVLYPVHFD